MLIVVTVQHNISVTNMSALLKFECRVPVGGYRIVTFDERKFFDLQLDPASDDDSILPPANLTEDEQSLLKKWGMRMVPWGDRRSIWHELQEVFEPNSERIRCFDLFEETSTPYLDFANALKTLDGAKALADRFGFLHRMALSSYGDGMSDQGNALCGARLGKRQGDR